MNLENAQGLNRVLPYVSRWDQYRIKNMGVKFYVGEEQRQGWSGKLPFYVFWCDQCEDFSYGYPHSYVGNRYLLCHRCHAKIDFVPWWAPFKMTADFIRDWVSWKLGGGT